MFKLTIQKLKIVAIAAISLLVVAVVLQNTQTVDTHLLFFTLTMPNAAFLFGTLIIGFAIGVLTAGHIVSTVTGFRAIGQPKEEPSTRDDKDHDEQGISAAAKPHVGETVGAGK